MPFVVDARLAGIATVELVYAKLDLARVFTAPRTSSVLLKVQLHFFLLVIAQYATKIAGPSTIVVRSRRRKPG
jgi:hypothetical protein